MSIAKNYQNWPMFHGAIQKIKVAHFYGLRCTNRLVTDQTLSRTSLQ